MEMKIRKATRKDLKEICDIVAEGKADEEKMQHPSKSLLSLRKKYSKKRGEWMGEFGKELKYRNEAMFVALLDNMVVGVGKVSINKDRGELDRLYIKKKFRGKGIGKGITIYRMNYLKKRKVKYVDANMYVRNKPSLKLHEDLGFKYTSYRMEKKLR
jgi:ribosomal protein S18 acetylase RimI-like enzyme